MIREAKVIQKHKQWELRGPQVNNTHLVCAYGKRCPKQGQWKSEKFLVSSPLIDVTPANELVGGRHSYGGIKNKGNTYGL